MDRTVQMKEYLKEYPVSRIEDKIMEAKNYSKDSLSCCVEALLNSAIERQHQKTWWYPGYLILFHLLTGLETGSHEYQIMVSDQKIYLDEQNIVKYWKADFLYDDEEEERNIKIRLQEKFIRINEYELNSVKKWVFYEYKNLMEVYWKKQIFNITNLKVFKTLDKSKPFVFLFGDYMGKLNLTFRYQEE